MWDESVQSGSVLGMITPPHHDGHSGAALIAGLISRARHDISCYLQWAEFTGDRG